jgi:hypothetical protein
MDGTAVLRFLVIYIKGDVSWQLLYGFQKVS